MVEVYPLDKGWAGLQFDRWGLDRDLSIALSEEISWTLVPVHSHIIVGPAGGVALSMDIFRVSLCFNGR